MASNYQNEGKQLSCTDFDLLLTEAIDGLLAGEQLAAFRAHADACATCGPLFTLAQQGQSWLKQMEEVEPPANLVPNILAVTSMREAKATATAIPAQPGWGQRVADWAIPAVRGMMQPRFAMTAAMAFFSVSLVLNVSGVKWSTVSRMDLRPAAILNQASVQYHETTSKLIRYYDNNRLVYKLQSAVDAFNSGKQKEEDKNKPQDEKKKDRKNDKKEQREHEQNENYTLQEDGTLLAIGFVKF